MIKIICGVYGGKHGMKRPGDPPFSLPPEEEARLVARKVAAYVNMPAIEAPQDEYVPEDAPIGFDETPPEDFTEDEAEIVEELVDLETLSAKEFRALGKEYGLTFKVGMTKGEMVAAIEAAQIELALGEDGEPAPEFDATEAVL